ncbi:MAG: extracellular solute-binding protein [Chloroflexi bacterium]|nr:extracellular solute-binding protein [Chloroflexota bacterium]
MIQKIVTMILALATLSGITAGCAPGSPVTPQPTATTPPRVVSPRTGWEERWEKTLLAAKKEKSALVYMAPSPETQRALTETFKQKFDIDLEFIIGRGAVLGERIFAERRAGLFLGDVVIQGNTVQLLTFKPKDVQEKLEPLLILPEIADPNVWLGGRFPFLDRDRTIIYFFASMRNYVGRNTELVKDGEVKSINDLLQPRWKGQIIMFDPTIPGSGSGWYSLVYGISGKEKGADYMRQFVKQEPVITRDDRMIVEGLARGKYKLGIGLLEGLFTEFRRNGAPIEWVRTMEGNFLAPSMGDISILKNAPHPNAATVLLNWLLTREGQTIVSRASGTPSARTDVPTAGLDPAGVLPPGEKFYLETEEDVLLKDELMARAREIFAPLLK